MINFDDILGSRKMKIYGIVGDYTTDAALAKAKEEGMEFKTYDFQNFWYVNEYMGGDRKVIFSCRRGVELGILEQIAQVAESGNPLIVNSLQKLKGAAIKNCKVVGVKITPCLSMPGITSITQLEEIVKNHGMVVRTVSYDLEANPNIDDLNIALEFIRTSDVLSKATIIDLGHYFFEKDEDAMVYMKVLADFIERHGDHFEYRFGKYIE